MKKSKKSLFDFFFCVRVCVCVLWKMVSIIPKNAADLSLLLARLNTSQQHQRNHDVGTSWAGKSSTSVVGRPGQPFILHSAVPDAAL